MPTGNDMIELHGVTKRFGPVVAVDNVDLSVRAGEFLTLLGPSGCGKTTLLRMIGGFETPTSGAVLLDGRDVTFTPPYRRDVNQVFQSYALFPHLSVHDNIAFGLRMKKVPRGERHDRVAQAIELVSLTGLESRRPSELSGGQRQRVALARAIVCQPKVLLLDEPLGALDAKLRHAMQIELKRLQKRLGITFLFVTHDQEEALVMSDRIAVVHDGHIAQLGSPVEIYDSPRTRFVADFIGQANIFHATSLGGDPPRMRLPGDIDLCLPLAGFAPGTQNLLLSIRPEKVHLARLRPAGDNVFAARVVEEFFQGPADQLLLRTPAGFELTALAPNASAAAQPLHKGDEVFCLLHPDDIVVLREE